MVTIVPTRPTGNIDPARHRAQLRGLAREILQVYGVQSAPVQLLQLPWSREDLVIFGKDLWGKYDGLLRWNPRQNRFFLYYDDGHPARARFNQAHELAHYILPEHHYAIRMGLEHRSAAGRWSTTDRMEQEADMVAAELLVPAYLYQASAYDLGLRGIRAVRDAFDVSVPCAALKLIEHASEPAALICLKNGVVAWWRHNDAMAAEGVFGVTVGSRPPAGVAALAVTVPGEYRLGDFRASDWFNNPGRDPRLFAESFVVSGITPITAYVLLVG